MSKQLLGLLLERYLTNPLEQDAAVRKFANIPDDAYYRVSVWPVAGIIVVDRPGARSVPKAKISKSDQPSTK